MIQLIGLIVAVYGIARLLLVAIQQSDMEANRRKPLVWVIVMGAIAVIGVLALLTFTAGLDLPRR